jgi:hypothetical protein
VWLLVTSLRALTLLMQVVEATSSATSETQNDQAYQDSGCDWSISVTNACMIRPIDGSEAQGFRHNGIAETHDSAPVLWLH